MVISSSYRFLQRQGDSGGAIRSGMIRMGFNMVSIYPRNGVTIENRGVMVFNGRCSIGNDSYISVGRHRKIVFGDRCTATASLKLASHCGITFGDKVSIGWNCMFIDTDFHRLTRVDGKKVKAYGEECKTAVCAPTSARISVLFVSKHFNAS